MGNPHTPSGPSRPGRLTRLAAVLAVAAVVIGGGSFLGLRLAGSDRPAAAGLLASSRMPGHGLAAAGATSSAAETGALTAMLGSPAAASALTASNGQAAGALAGYRARALRRCLVSVRRLRASGHRWAARLRLRMCLRHFRRLRLLRVLLRAEHGQITFRAKDGKTRTIAFERGVIQSVTGRVFVLKAADGTTFSWHLISRTVIVTAWHRVSPRRLAAGERVFVAGPVADGTDDARLILIRS